MPIDESPVKLPMKRSSDRVSLQFQEFEEPASKPVMLPQFKLVNSSPVSRNVASIPVEMSVPSKGLDSTLDRQTHRSFGSGRQVVKLSRNSRLDSGKHEKTESIDTPKEAEPEEIAQNEGPDLQSSLKLDNATKLETLKTVMSSPRLESMHTIDFEEARPPMMDKLILDQIINLQKA